MSRHPLDEDYLVPRQYDKRVKLDTDDHEKIRRLRNEDEKLWSTRALAREFNVSRRLIQFILDPAKHKENLKRRAERGGYKTETAKQTAYRRVHRAYKRELLAENKLTIKNKEK